MAVAWLLSPYEIVERPGGLLSRRVLLDRLTPEIDAAGGTWSEAEIDGDRAVCRVLAPTNVIQAAQRDLGLTVLDDPASVWTPTRTVPILRAGEIAWDSGQEHACRTIESVLADVPDPGEHGRRLAEAERLATLAGRDGYVRLDGMLWPEAARLLVILGRAGYGLDRVSTGTFPTTGILDNFARASLGPNWANNPFAWGSDPFAIEASARLYVSGAGIEASANWNVASYGPGCEVHVTITTKGATGDWVSLFLRHPVATGTVTDMDGYEAAATVEAGADTWRAGRFDDFVLTQLGASAASEVASGDGAGGEALGSTISVYQRVSGVWSLLLARTDSTYANAGYLGVYGTGTPVRLDDFGGGTVVTAAASLVAPNRELRRGANLRR